MATSSVVIKGLELNAIQNQMHQLKSIQGSVMPDDSVEANTLRDTVKLLSQIESELRKQSATKH